MEREKVCPVYMAPCVQAQCAWWCWTKEACAVTLCAGNGGQDGPKYPEKMAWGDNDAQSKKNSSAGDGADGIPLAQIGTAGTVRSGKSDRQARKSEMLGAAGDGALRKSYAGETAILYALMHEDFSDLTTAEIAEVFAVDIGTIRRVMHQIKLQTGRNVPHKIRKGTRM